MTPPYWMTSIVTRKLRRVVSPAAVARTDELKPRRSMFGPVIRDVLFYQMSMCPMGHSRVEGVAPWLTSFSATRKKIVRLARGTPAVGQLSTVLQTGLRKPRSSRAGIRRRSCLDPQRRAIAGPDVLWLRSVSQEVERSRCEVEWHHRQVQREYQRDEPVDATDRKGGASDCLTRQISLRL